MVSNLVNLDIGVGLFSAYSLWLYSESSGMLESSELDPSSMLNYKVTIWLLIRVLGN
jgi:hypothetical protein